MTDASWSRLARQFSVVLRQPMGRAVAVAAVLALVLALAVLVVWSVNPGTGDDPTTLSAALRSPSVGPGGSVPTPRVVATRPPRTATAAASAQTPASAPTQTEATAVPTADGPTVVVRAPTADPAGPADAIGAAAVPTPAEGADAPAIAPRPPSAAPPPAPTRTPQPEPTSPPEPTVPPTPEPLYAAEDAADLAAWASGSWSTAEDQLVYEVATNDAQPWIVGPYQPDDDAYAVEAEVRVRSTDPSVQCQTFGLVTDTAGAAQGAGVIFPCQGEPVRARLADVSAWTGGYFLAPELAAKAFDPGEEWHTYRLEVDGRERRLLIDGDEMAVGTVPTVAAGAPTEIGLWSQGVGLGVRRVAVLPLDAADA